MVQKGGEVACMRGGERGREMQWRIQHYIYPPVEQSSDYSIILAKLCDLQIQDCVSEYSWDTWGHHEPIKDGVHVEHGRDGRVPLLHCLYSAGVT